MSKPRKFPPHRPLRALAERVAAKRTTPKAEHAPTNTELTFARAASTLGVAALPPHGGRVRAAKAPAAAVVPPDPEFVVREEDGWLEGYRRALGPRVLARVRGNPRATLDLHGAKVASAHDRLTGFLTRAPYAEPSVVRVIVGKGRHSPGGHAVLAGEIGHWLSSGSAARRVLAFRTAPPHLGGSGSVLVLLVGVTA